MKASFFTSGKLTDQPIDLYVFTQCLDHTGGDLLILFSYLEKQEGGDIQSLTSISNYLLIATCNLNFLVGNFGLP